MKKKEIQALTKKVNGKMTAIASTEAVDRVGDSLKVNDWDFKNFKKNPVLQAGHDYHPLSTIGIAKNICVENNQVIFEPQFHEITSLAREVKKMYEEKYLTAWSVGFIPAKEEGGKHELLEVSAVAVPANAEALTTLSQKSIENGTKDEEKEINNFIKKLKEKKETYKCECIDCGYKTTSEKHCKDIKCEKCGGEMRRQERPGTGKRIYKKEIKPYKNEHSCRLKDPKQYDSFKRGKRKSDGKEYSVIYGIKKGKLEDQAYRYNKDIWTENEARKHCKKHNGIKFEPIKKENKKEIKLWNKSLPNIFKKEYDIEGSPSLPTAKEYEIYTKYLGCQVRHITLMDFSIPNPLLGSYLSACKEVLQQFKLIDERNIQYGSEYPLQYEVIKLNSKEEDDFLIEGTQFYKNGDKKFIIKFQPSWFGIQLKIVTRNKEREWNKNLLKDIQEWVKKNNKLKGECFCLNGEFLDRGKTKWDDIILPKNIIKSVNAGINQLIKKGNDITSRGMMFIGNPGTGKTLTGKAMMSNLKDTTFIWVSSRDFEMISSNRVLTLAFDLARDLGPTILFMEDIDTWLKGSCIDLLKTELDGMKLNKGIITILTSNEPNNFPDALLDRPGRFHDVLEFPNPDKGLRKEMINKWSKIKDIDSKIMDKIIKETEGFSAAHMKELIDFAKLIKEDDNIKMVDAILLSLEKIKLQKTLINNIRQTNENNKENKTNNKKFDISKKEGKVISRKNKTVIDKTIENLKNTVGALEKLLILSDSSKEPKKVDTPEKAIKNDNLKVVKNKSKMVQVQKLSEKQLAVRILQQINKQSSYGLNKIK